MFGHTELQVDRLWQLEEESTLTSKHSQPTPPWPTTEETMSLKDVYLRPSHSSLDHLLVPTKPTATRICNTHGTKTEKKKLELF